MNVVMDMRMRTVNPDVFCVPPVPTRHCPMTDFLDLGRFDGIRDLWYPPVRSLHVRTSNHEP
jgi:hypothetical protein